MTSIHHGTTGTKRQSFRKGNSRTVIADLLKKDPKISDDDMLEKIRPVALKDSEFLDLALVYYIAGERRNVMRGRFAQTYTPEVITEAAAEKEAAVTEMAERIKSHVKRMVLMEMIGENGKAFGDMTKADGAKSIGWRSQVFAKLNGKQTVREAFSEDDLWKLIK